MGLNGAGLTLGVIGAVALAAELRSRTGSLGRTQKPFDEREVRLQRRVGGYFKIETMTLGRAVRQGLLDYYSRVGSYQYDDADNPERLDDYFGWRAQAKALLVGPMKPRDRALYVHHLEGRPYTIKTRGGERFPTGRTLGAGRAMHAELERMAKAEGARWLVALSARIDGERSPLGFWEKMGWTVLVHDPERGDRDEEVVIVKDLRSPAGSTNRLPHALRFLDAYTGHRHDGLAAYYPKTAAGTLRPGRGEAVFWADGIGFIGDTDGTMVPMDAEALEPMPGNEFDPAKFSALVDAIEAGEKPIVFPGYAFLSMDDGVLTAQVRDGNHRTFAALAAGGSMSWVMMGDQTRQDLDRREGTGTEALYRAIRKAQKEAGVPLFTRKNPTTLRPSKALDALVVAERRALTIGAELRAAYQALLKKHGKAESGFPLIEQMERPQLFWRMRYSELRKQHGEDGVERQVDDRVKDALQAEASALGASLYDLRKAAGLAYGETLNPQTRKAAMRG